jgi:glycosyltransferase involved in cell wall biosynthesis
LVDLLNRRCFCLGWRRLIVWAPYGVDGSIVVPLSNVIGTSISVPDKKLILHVGTVADEYGASFMIEGLASLKMIRDDWRAVFVGHGPALDACRAKIKAMGLEKFVDMPGFVPEEDLRVLLSQASIFLSHLYNTEQDWARCPSKVYYYMAKGRPVVTTTVGENRVALGESGFYYDADSPENFSMAASLALDAGPNWRPAYSPENVTWENRTAELLSVINSFFQAKADAQ